MKVRSITRPVIFLATGILVCLFLKNAFEPKLKSLLDRSPSLHSQVARYHTASLKRYELGFGPMIADLFWIRLLANARHTPAEPGKVSWEFVQLDAITSLDRKFQRAYPFGGAFLSVFLRDGEGARLLLEKWTRYFSQDWRSFYTLGYHLFFELQRYEEAAVPMLHAAKMEGAPPWLTSLGIRLLSETGSLTQALRMALSLFPALNDPDSQNRLKLRIRSLRYGLEKAGWNEALETFKKRNSGKSPSSLEALREFRNEHSREIASVLTGLEVEEELQPLLMERFDFRLNEKDEIVSVKSHPELENAGIYHPKGT